VFVSKTVDLTPVLSFLPCRTPDGWVRAAIADQRTMLIDHANCEKKAAATALSLMHRYTDNFILLNKMSRLAREELRHFEQVLKIMAQRGVVYEPISASRYAAGLRDEVRRKEPGKLMDTLLVGALIEARSCERFAALIPHLDDVLADFYTSLLKSEARHFHDYLKLAEQTGSSEEVAERLSSLKAREKELVESTDGEFRFHSGPPAMPSTAASSTAAASAAI
jgi:tRNA 2-(methylsulfanyl)-N6-isopentenyladenosine37 hydroxylase